MKKTGIVGLLALLLAFAAPNYAYSGDGFIDVKAKSAIIFEPESGRVLWQKNAFEPLPMASTTKIMTAIVTLENADLDSTVEVSGRAAGTPPVKMGLSKGEKISLRGLVYALMLQSSNDAAVAIAEHVGGSVDGFCELMTLKAKQLGALDTVFETPNGLDAENHRSSAYDMAKIAAYAISNKEFLGIISTPNYSLKSDKRTYDIINKDRFLNEYEGALGIKTGYTGGAGHCFVGAAKRDGMTLISVVLASGWGDAGRERKWTDTKALMNYGFKNYAPKTVIRRGDKAGSVAVEQSKTEKIDVFFEDDVTMAMTNTEQFNVDIHLAESVKAPVKRGDIVGNAKIIVGGKCERQFDLFAASDAEIHNLKSCAEKVLKIYAGLMTNGEI